MGLTEVVDGRRRGSVPEQHRCASGSGSAGELLWPERVTEGELRAKMDGREKERARAAITGSRGGGGISDESR
jgi:hypothetical protein